MRNVLSKLRVLWDQRSPRERKIVEWLGGAIGVAIFGAIVGMFLFEYGQCRGGGDGGEVPASDRQHAPIEDGEAIGLASPSERIDAGGAYACAIDVNDALRCWGSWPDLSDAVATERHSVSAGTDFACTLSRVGKIDCWGHAADNETSTEPDGVFVQVSAGGSHVCALRNDQQLVCWGFDRGESSPRNAPPEGTYSFVSSGAAHSCAVDTDTQAVCWGYDGDGQTGAPSTDGFRSVSAGVWHTCGLRTDDTVVCWGANGKRNSKNVGQTDVPDEKFSAVSAAQWSSCGITVISGEIRCWGGQPDRELEPPTADGYVALDIWVDVGEREHGCGVRGDGVVECWGDSGDGRTKPPLDLRIAVEQQRVSSTIPRAPFRRDRPRARQTWVSRMCASSSPCRV